MQPTSRPVSLGIHVKIFHGIGSVAYGIKDNGFAYFLLMFYSTVVGLDAELVGTALLIAMIFDALSDPIVGYLSDNTRSRLGRRHPFMYASAVPVAACYALLWNPPQLSSGGLFFYLLIMAVLIRTLITLFETPSSSLLPELTSDYDERTSLQSFRHFFGWTGGSLLAVVAFGFLLVPTETQPVGTLNREGYSTFGWLSAWIMFFAIMISSLGTQRHIRYFGEETSRQKASITRAFTDIKETLVNPNFFALFLSTIAGSVASGLTTALTFLMLTYFWGFTSMQIFYWTGLVVISALLGFVIAPKAAKTLGKKKAVMVLGVLAFSIQPLPVLLRLLNVLPENGAPLLFPLVATINTLDLGMIIAMQIVSASMIADLVEQSELATGRRSEGIFFSTLTFVRKTNQGIGVFIAGIVLAAVQFPEGASPAEVDTAIMWNLGAVLVPIQWLLWALMLWALAYYRLNKTEHESNLLSLGRR